MQVAGRTGTTKPGVLNEFPAGLHKGSSFTVWPPMPQPVAWPPRQVLDRDGLAVLMAEMVQGTEPLTAEFDAPDDCWQCGQPHGILTRSLPKPAGADDATGLTWAGLAAACGNAQS